MLAQHVGQSVNPGEFLGPVVVRPSEPVLFYFWNRMNGISVAAEQSYDERGISFEMQARQPSQAGR